MTLQGRDQNKSPSGWWVACIVQRFQYDDEDQLNDQSRCHAWKNTVIFQARDRQHAYEKATGYQPTADISEWSDDSGRTGKWVFEGLSSLLPIYDEIDPEGTEIYFEDYRDITVAEAQSWIRQRTELEAFDGS